MQQSFTHQYMKENCGCYTEEQLMRCSFMSTDPVTLQSILTSEIPLKDKYWFVCKKLATKEQNQQIAIPVAEIVLPIFEKKYPEDKRPREAIEAAKAYIAGHIPLELLMQKRRDAAAAASTGYAAASAAASTGYASAYAADSAAAASVSAAYAADSAAAASVSAASAAAYASDAYAYAAAASVSAASAAAYDAAAYASDAYAYAAAASVSAAYAAAIKQQLLDYLINFCN